MELLVLGGRSPAHAISMLIPEAYQGRPELPQEVRDFYAYHSSLIEPWDGPAAVAFTDGRVIGATLDRNGLRPGRWLVTKDGWVVLASETGVLEATPDQIVGQGPAAPRQALPRRPRARPDRAGRARSRPSSPRRRPYGEWLHDRVVHIEDLPEKSPRVPRVEPLRARQLAFGWTEEDLQRDARPDGARRRRADRLDGQRRRAGRPVRPAPAAVLLLQAALRPGHEPGDRPDPRVGRDEPRGRASARRSTCSARRRTTATSS